jgi:hypothetical protein
MSKDKHLREQLQFRLNSDDAHANFEAATKDLPAELRGKRPKGAEHSPWEIVEHLRIAQWDILEYTRDPKHVSPDFPSGYWPKSPEPPSDAAWKKSLDAFHKDLAEMSNLIGDESKDVLAPIPHTDGKTLLRQALLLADHNAYHLGQLVLVRRLLGAWK